MKKSTIISAPVFANMTNVKRQTAIGVAQHIGAQVVSTLDQLASPQERGAAVIEATAFGTMKMPAAVAAIAGMCNGGEQARVVQFVNDSIKAYVALKETMTMTAEQLKTRRRGVVRACNAWADNGKEGSKHAGGHMGYVLKSEVGSASSDYVWSKIVVETAPDSVVGSVPAQVGPTKKEVAEKVEVARKEGVTLGQANSKKESVLAAEQIAKLAEEVKSLRLEVMAEKEAHCRTMALGISYATGLPASASQLRMIKKAYTKLANSTKKLAKIVGVTVALPVVPTSKAQAAAVKKAAAAAEKAAARS